MPGADEKDPRGQEEKARANLKANAEMGLAPAHGKRMRKPSVTKETFGEEEGFKPSESPKDDTDDNKPEA